MTLDELAGFKPAPNVLFQELEGEMVLLNLETEHYFGLDDIGTRFWQLWTKHMDLDTTVACMLIEFDVEEATLRADLATLVKELSGAGLIISIE